MISAIQPLARVLTPVVLSHNGRKDEDIKQKSVLLIGSWDYHIISTAKVFAGAGFQVDLISYNKTIKSSRYIINIFYSSINHEIIRDFISINKIEEYRVIVVIDDLILRYLADAQDIDNKVKLKLLPVISADYFCHIYSKIGLSKLFTASGVITPQYTVAQDINDVVRFSEEYGFPLLVKKDSSSGGTGIFECKNIDDITRLPNRLFNSPVLVQKKINGIVIGIDAYYRDAKLIYYSYSDLCLCNDNDYGPSSVRIYRQIGEFGDSLYGELQKIGQALGANGFANITAIHSTENNTRYYIEADMRPTAWIFIGKYIGFDLSYCIKMYYEYGEMLSGPLSVNNKLPLSIVLPLFFRINFVDILLNKYNVWKYIYCTGSGYISIYLTSRIYPFVVTTLKNVLPDYLYRQVKTAYKFVRNGRKLIARSGLFRSSLDKGGGAKAQITRQV